MRWLLAALFLGITSLVEALNSKGDYRLLVVLEELAEKSKYSKYIADLEGKELPKSAIPIESWY